MDINFIDIMVFRSDDMKIFLMFVAGFNLGLFLMSLIQVGDDNDR